MAFPQGLGNRDPWSVPTRTAQPSSPTNGGDGGASHDTQAEKTAAYTWKPFVAPDIDPESQGGLTLDDATVTAASGDNTATIAAGKAKI